MVASGVNEIQRIRIEKEIFIGAPIDIAFEALLEELGPEGEVPVDRPLPMVLEAWPGGRWFRDLGANAGHLWGHVQVIKPPELLEISGPLFMSYACANHLQYRLTAEGSGTRIKFLHRGIGEYADDHVHRVEDGWTYKLDRVCRVAEAKGASR